MNGQTFGKVVTVLERLPENAPEIIRSVNPVNWFRDVINDSRQYRLAKKQIELEYARDRDAHARAIKELEIKKDAYVKTIQNNQKIIKIQSKNLRTSFKFLFNSLDSINMQSQQIVQQIISSSNSIDTDVLNLLIEFHKTLFVQIRELYRDMNNTMDREHDRFSRHLLNSKQLVNDAKKAIED